MLAMIDAYRYLLSPYLGHHCRFHPTCSLYARECIAVHGPLTGLLLAIRRISKCHPWHEGGIDPVPVVSPAVTTAQTLEEARA